MADPMQAMRDLLAISPAAKLVQGGKNWIEKHADIAVNASREAFPKQGPDSTQRNALRHSIWTGSMANDLGFGQAGPISGLAAKGIGYLHEGLSNADYLKTYGKVNTNDLRHDLNNNAIGVNVAMAADSQQAMIDKLTRMAKYGPQTKAPGYFDLNVGRLTYDK